MMLSSVPCVLPSMFCLRKHVLAASLALVEDHGVAAISLREVGRHARVSHQAHDHHFRSKELVVAELVTLGFTRLAERLEATPRSGCRSRDLTCRTGARGTRGAPRSTRP